MDDKVIDLTEKNGVYVSTEEAKPIRPRERVIIHDAHQSNRRAKITSTRPPVLDFIDGAKECLSLFDHIIKRMG